MGVACYVATGTSETLVNPVEYGHQEAPRPLRGLVRVQRDPESKCRHWSELRAGSVTVHEGRGRPPSPVSGIRGGLPGGSGLCSGPRVLLRRSSKKPGDAAFVHVGWRLRGRLPVSPAQAGDGGGWGRDWGLRIKSTAGFSPSAARPAPDRTSGCPGELRREDTCGQTGAAPRPGHRTPSRKAPGESFRLCQVGEALQVFPGSSCPVAAKSRSADPSPSVSPLRAEGARSDSFRRTGRRPSAVPGDRGPFALGSNCSPFRPQVKTLLLADTCFLNCISPPLVPAQETPRLIPEPLPCVV